jgi:UDP-N-acetylglucosamine 2-epimerase
MPEEINRVLTDHCSDILFTPSKLASQNLKNEGIHQNSISNVGDIMYDIFLSVYKNLKKN